MCIQGQGKCMCNHKVSYRIVWPDNSQRSDTTYKIRINLWWFDQMPTKLNIRLCNLSVNSFKGVTVSQIWSNADFTRYIHYPDSTTQRAPALTLFLTIGWRASAPATLPSQLSDMLYRRAACWQEFGAVSKNTMASNASMSCRLLERHTRVTNVRQLLVRSVNGNIQRLFSGATHIENEFELGDSTSAATNFTASPKTRSRQMTVRPTQKHHSQVMSTLFTLHSSPKFSYWCS